MIKCKNRRIEVTTKNYEAVNFDIGTNKFFTQFNGLGGINYYHHAASKRFFINAKSFLNIYINEKPLNILSKKKVVNGGRIQKIIYRINQGKIEINQFGYESHIYYHIKLKLKDSSSLAFIYDYSHFVDVPKFLSNIPYKYIKENSSYIFNVNSADVKEFVVALSFVDYPTESIKMIKQIEKELNLEIDQLNIPNECQDDVSKTLYISGMFTALENYKELDGFSAFTAGVNYTVPFRTYYRDSYWTTLCLYKYKPELIKSQIITLAKGIKEDGECPSAVVNDYSWFWGGHYDSPFFFIMMVTDYVNHLGDKSILSIKINDRFTIIELCELVMKHMMKFTDETHLLVKKGPHNRLDWVDAVDRQGYVTYDECLYYRALTSLSYLLPNKEDYKKEAVLVKNSINRILWSEEKGYYLNYIDGDFKEDNLSIDTLLTVLFDIAPREKKNKLLDNMEKILYSKNHSDLDDFGVMCCYPHYKKYDAIVSYSGQQFCYHNMANWPYWSSLFAYTLMLNNRDYHYALDSLFVQNLKNKNLTLVEYYSPYHPVGSNLQAWSATVSFALQYCKDNFFLLK